jgi:hypothetical protein
MKKIKFIVVITLLCSCTKHSDHLRDNINSEQKGVPSCDKLNEKQFFFLPSPDLETHVFILKFVCSDGKLTAELTGPSREGEHGLFYFKASIDSIFMDSSNIKLKYVQGNLYSKQISLNDKNIEQYNSGFSRNEFILEGELQNDSLLIAKCKSEYGDCYSDTLKFRLKQEK